MIFCSLICLVNSIIFHSEYTYNRSCYRSKQHLHVGSITKSCGELLEWGCGSFVSSRLVGTQLNYLCVFFGFIDVLSTCILCIPVSLKTFNFSSLRMHVSFQPFCRITNVILLANVGAPFHFLFQKENSLHFFKYYKNVYKIFCIQQLRKARITCKSSFCINVAASQDISIHCAVVYNKFGC